MSYEEFLAQLAGRLAEVLTALWADVGAGRLTVADFTELAASLVEAATGRGQTAAHAAFLAWAEAATGAPQPPPPPPPPTDPGRLAAALDTITASDLDTAMQLHRLALNEPVQAATAAFGQAMAASPVVAGWRRGLEPGACQLCRWWWREGRVWRADHPMPRHTGCTCTQIPVAHERTSNHQEGAEQ